MNIEKEARKWIQDNYPLMNANNFNDCDELDVHDMISFAQHIKEKLEQRSNLVSLKRFVIGEQHLIRATVWYMEHQEHVTSVVSEAEQKYPPSDEYDVRNPNVWKPQHWKWFIEKYL